MEIPTNKCWTNLNSRFFFLIFSESVVDCLLSFGSEKVFLDRHFSMVQFWMDWIYRYIETKNATSEEEIKTKKKLPNKFKNKNRFASFLYFLFYFIVIQFAISFCYSRPVNSVYFLTKKKLAWIDGIRFYGKRTASLIISQKYRFDRLV